jgi:hypothetical protein
VKIPHDSDGGRRGKRKDVRDAARKALSSLLEPLAGFVLDSGLSARELNVLFRTAVVKYVAARQIEKTSRINISGIAASTGIPRPDITRILTSDALTQPHEIDFGDHTTNRILTIWHEDPQFTTSNGQPAELRIFGRGATFEALARIHGRGLPMRAMLDELVRIGAVELLPSQKVRAKTSVAIDRGTSPRAIKAFGDRASDLLGTMLQNMRNPENPRFLAHVERGNVSARTLPLFRKELSIKAADFLADVEESLGPIQLIRRKKNRSKSKSRISVTVFYSEGNFEKPSKTDAVVKRKNFTRSS